jgi:thiamine biosynthesis lipoprotein
MAADAWATALSVLAPAEMMAMATQRGLAVRALTRREGRVVEWLSPALRAMIDD